MSLVICLAALAFLMWIAYRGHSVILFAPVAALGAVLLTAPAAVLPVYSGLFMDKMVVFVRSYLPVFLLGAVFGKVIELAGFSRAIVSAVIRLVGGGRARGTAAVLSIVLVCALLTYGGVSLFVVVFAVYPFASELFRQSDIPKRLIPGTIALGAFTFTMDVLPGTPQIQNIIPTTFFKTSTWAAPVLGTIGAVYIAILGLAYLGARVRKAAAAGEGYGAGHANEPAPTDANTADSADTSRLPHPLLAILPLVLVGVLNKLVAQVGIPYLYGDTTHTITLAASAKPITSDIAALRGIWSVEVALVAGILLVVATGWTRLRRSFNEGIRSAVGGALLASMNTASEYGFGAVIAALPGFTLIAEALRRIPNPLVNEAITVTTLAGITGSASGGMSIALAAMADRFSAAAAVANIPPDVLHRVAAMASGGMDTLPHNGAVITLLAVTGLTHRTSYRDIFAITLIKSSAVFVIIGVYYLTRWV